jgi:hypothetical protein
VPSWWRWPSAARTRSLAAEVGSYATGEKTLATRLYPLLRTDELLTADRNFYSLVRRYSIRRVGAMFRRACPADRVTIPRDSSSGLELGLDSPVASWEARPPVGQSLFDAA